MLESLDQESAREDAEESPWRWQSMLCSVIGLTGSAVEEESVQE